MLKWIKIIRKIVPLHMVSFTNMGQTIEFAQIQTPSLKLYFLKSGQIYGYSYDIIIDDPNLYKHYYY